AGAVEAVRAGVRGRQLEALREAPIQAPLQRVVARIALPCADRSRSKVGMQARPVWLLRVEVSAGGQLVTPSADIGDIEKRLSRQLPLEAERPALRVGPGKILLERAVLRIQQAGRPPGSSRKLGKPIGVSPPRCGPNDLGKDRIRCGYGQFVREHLRIQRLVADLIAAAPHRLAVSEQLSAPP